MLITEVIERVMNHIHQNKSSKRTINKTESFYLSKVMPRFDNDKEFNEEVILAMIDDFTVEFENKSIPGSTFYFSTRCLRMLIDCYQGNEIGRYRYYRPYKYIPNKTHLDVIDEIINYNKSKSKDIFIKVISSMRLFFCYLEEKNIDVKELNHEIIFQFLYKFQKTHKYTLNMINAIDLIVEYLNINCHCSINVNVKKLKSKRRRRTLIPPFNSDDISRMIEYASNQKTIAGSRFAAIVGLMAFTGMRACDVLNLKFENIDWGRQNISFVQSKTMKSLVLPLPTKAMNLMADYIVNYRMKPVNKEFNNYIFLTIQSPIRPMMDHMQINVQIKKYSNILGIELKEEQGLHSVRRMFATKLVNSDVDTKIASQMLGHSSFQSDDRYMSYDSTNVMKCALNFEKIPISKGGIYFENK